MAAHQWFPEAEHYWLTHAHVPTCAIAPGQMDIAPKTPEGLGECHLEIVDGKLRQILPAHQAITPKPDIPILNLGKRIIFPGFVDMHTHLDKGHIWQRSPNPDGTFQGAIVSTQQDAQQYYREEDVYRRMEFGLRCAYAHGTVAIRTHIDAFGEQAKIGFQVFDQLRHAWAGRLVLQGACLVTTDLYLTPAGERLADQMADRGAILGGVAYPSEATTVELTRLFELARDRHLNVDLHVDETGDRRSRVLHQVADVALKLGFTGQIVCGHCCSLGMQSLPMVRETLNLARKLNLAIVSLPMCNLYLQNRHPLDQPAWRGITRVHEIQAAGIPLAFASDNCRDPFFAFGDHDGLEVLMQSVRIAHLDHPYGDWCASVNHTPAQIMGLADQGIGTLQTGKTADFIVFSARYFSELFSRPQGDRLVIRQGQPIDTTLPDYRELDDLLLIN